MTREEAKEIANSGKNLKHIDSQCAELVDKIYDNFICSRGEKKE